LEKLKLTKPDSIRRKKVTCGGSAADKSDRIAAWQFLQSHALMNGMQLSLAEAKHILEAKKELFNPHPWSPVNNRAGSTPLYFNARVRLDGGAYRGLWFRASTFAHNLGTGTFQLSIEQPGVRSQLQLYRLDWRPFRSHLNGPDGPQELRGLLFKEGVTHEHLPLRRRREGQHPVGQSGDR
jgi:hypothetical protein